MVETSEQSIMITTKMVRELIDSERTAVRLETIGELAQQHNGTTIQYECGVTTLVLAFDHNDVAATPKNQLDKTTNPAISSLV